MITAICNSIDETHKLAKEFFSKLHGGEIIGLNGELGAGKTEFVRGFAKCISEDDDVSSPSFVLQNIYTASTTNTDQNLNSKSNITKIYHWDIYRATNGIEIDELVEGKREKDAITLIEWAEKSEELQKLLDYEVQIEFLEIQNATLPNQINDHPRKITIENNIFHKDIIKISDNKHIVFFNPVTQINSPEKNHNKPTTIIQELQNELHCSPLLTRILVNRGVTSSTEAKNFLNPTFQDALSDPSIIKNINELADKIIEFTINKTQMVIYCDFDVDGLTAGAQLYLYLKALGANIGYFIPSRFEDGYGLSLNAVESIAKSSSKVLITVDCGISNVQSIALAKQLGLTVFVVDHHIVVNPPKADIIVDPEQDGCPYGKYKLCAAGLIWMILIVIRKKTRELEKARDKKIFIQIPDPKEYIDLAVLGTVCDMVPLLGPNRIIAKRGIEALKQTKRHGLIALMNILNLTNSPRLNAGNIGFSLGPRINAVGRIGHAINVFELLITENENDAKTLAKQIDNFNEERKNIERDSIQICMNLFEKEPDLLTRPAFAIFNEKFHPGVMGIVAQRLVEKYHIPAAVMTLNKITDTDGNIHQIVKGSVRGVPGFNVVNALKNIAHTCINYGGHVQAGGFSVELKNIEAFQNGFIEQANNMIDKTILRQKEYICDCEVSLKELDFNSVNEIAKTEPHGIGNPAPLFLTRNVLIKNIYTLKNDSFKIVFKEDSVYLNGLLWNAADKKTLLTPETKVNILFTPEINNYNGNSAVQLILKEIWRD